MHKIVVCGIWPLDDIFLDRYFEVFLNIFVLGS